jgi:hypothetical protein
MTSAGRFLAPLVLAMLAGDIAAAEETSATFPNRTDPDDRALPGWRPERHRGAPHRQRMSEDWGQPVVIDNRPVATRSSAAQAAAKAEPDGYTLFMAIDSTLVMNQYLYKSLPYDPLADFAPITLTAKTISVLAVPAAGGPETVKALIARAKAQPGQTQLRRRHDHRPTDGPSIPQGGGPRHRLCALQGHP